MAIVAIIPARFASTRLPGKPLSDIHGKTMIQRVYERARAARRPDRVLVATDDERIAAVVRGFGGEARADLARPRQRHGPPGRGGARDRRPRSSSTCRATSRMLDPAGIDAAVEALLADADAGDGHALAAAALGRGDARAVGGEGGDRRRGRRALLLARADPPPAPRRPRRPARRGRGAVARGLARKHVGLYAYRREALLRFASLPPSPARAGRGARAAARARTTACASASCPRQGDGGVAVDTPEDLERVRALLAPEKGRTV